MCPDRYIISPKLHNALSSEVLPYSKNMVKRPGIYLVAFRLLKKGDNTLFYNYIYYPDIFDLTFLVFLSYYKNEPSNTLFEWGTQLIFINKDVMFKIEGFDKDRDVYKYMVNNPDLFSSVVSAISSIYEAPTTKEIFRYINKLNYATNDYNEMANFLYTAHIKNYDKFVQLILPSEYEDLKDRLAEPLSQDINIINSLLFVVNDINKFISTINETKILSVNEGSQKWRGQVNSMNSLLATLDNDYRNSLYNHNRYHVRYNTNLGYKHELDRSKFSFRNIHMNLGNVRWYSSSRKTKINRVF